MIGKRETVTITNGTSRATQMKVCECSNNHDVNRIMRLEMAGWASRSSVRGVANLPMEAHVAMVRSKTNESANTDGD